MKCSPRPVGPTHSTGVLLLVGAIACTTVGGGCGPDAGTGGTTGTGGTVVASDPWPKFASAVRGNPDPKAVRGAVSSLTAGLGNAPSTDRPPIADPSYLDAVATGLKLTDAEKKALAGAEYSGLDANHLSECLYLSDVALGLGVTSADPVAVRATAAFRLVCRQVVLAPAVFPRNQSLVPPVPPTYVLNRGSGTGLERAFTFVALCRQLDLDAYLIGPAEAADRPWSYGAPAPGQPPKGPFWAVGVRAEGGVLLYDPWRGQPVPGKAAETPATLADLRADPSACPWLKDGWDVTADLIKASGLFLSPPLSAVSPRMARMQEKLKDAGGVRLALDWATAVKAAEAVAAGAPVSGWNPPGDRFTPVRAIGSFLPLEQGGLDTTPEQDVNSVYFQYNISRLPIDRLLRTPLAISSKGAEQALQAMAAGKIIEAFLTPPTPREKLQRGQYNVVVGDLVKRRDDFLALLRGPTTAADAEQQKDWYRALNGVFDRVTQTQGTAEERTARDESEKFLRNSSKQIERVLGSMVAEAGVAEASYLLALAAHEQAEAMELAAAREAKGPGAADARKAAKEQWAKAAKAWNRYADSADAQAAGFPGRKVNADTLAARAAQLAR